MLRNILLIFLYLNTVFLNANINNLITKYQEYNAVASNLEFRYVMDIVDGSLVVTQENLKEIVILNDFSKGLTKDFIFFGSFTNVENKQAYTLIPNNQEGYDKIEVQQFKETHSTDGGIFYDDSKLLQFAYPSLQKGAITHLSYTINYSNPRFIRPSYLQSFIPIAQAKIIVKVHKKIELGFKELNFSNTSTDFKQYKKGKYNYYEWSVSDIKPYQYNMGDFYSSSFFSPHVALYVKSINKKPYFGTLDQLYNFYYDFISDVEDSSSEELKNIVKDITEGLSDREKAKAIYYWVHKNIKYIAYEEGYSGFIPTSAKEVFKKRYGDCKGMSCLIKNMMDIAGIPTYFTWVGTRHIPYNYHELPLPSVDNHMIAAQFINDSIVLLDGTFEYLDYGVSPYHIQGKEVLIGIGENKYKVHEVPISPANYSVTTDSVKIILADEKVVGQAKLFFTGFNKLELAHAFDGVKPEKYNQSFAHHFEKGNNKFEVTNNKVHNIFEYDKPANLEFEFEISDYYKVIGDEIYLNLNIDKSYGQMIVDTTSATFSPLENDFYCTKKFVTEFEIPDGYELSYVPKNKSFSNPDFEYNIKYTANDKSVVLEKEIKFEFLIILEDKVEEWNKMIKSLNKAYRNTLVLKKKSI